MGILGRKPKRVETRSLWETQFGGIVEKKDDGYYFIEPPKGWSQIRPGDKMPEHWLTPKPASAVAANELRSVAEAS